LISPWDTPFLERWIKRDLINNYQDYGIPLSSGKAYPYKEDGGENRPGLFLMSNVNYGHLPVDFGQQNHTLGFTTLKGFYNQGAFEAGRDTINDEQIDEIARSSHRFNTEHRLRFYVPPAIIPALEFTFAHNYSDNSQMFSRFYPDSFVDTRTTTFGAGIYKSYNLYPAFDLKIEGGYSFLRREGMVEFLPDTMENIHLFKGRVDLSRFFSSDKLILSAFAVYLNIPEQGLTETEKRSKFIAGLMLDYAFYRAIWGPKREYGKLIWERQRTRGIHFFGGYMIDEEIWDFEHRTDDFWVFGTKWLGLFKGRFDLWLFPMIFASDTKIAGTNQDYADDFPERHNTQFRINTLPRLRVIDEEVTPWLPEEWGGFHVSSLEFAFPFRTDIALKETDRTYQNFGIGAELWCKVVSKSLRGSTTLLTAAYEFQRYYVIKKNLHNFHFDIRLGWGRL